MITSNLWQAERIKTYRLTRLVYALLALAGLAIVGMLTMAAQNPTSFQPLAQVQLAFPVFLYVMLQQTVSVTPIIAIVYASLVMAIEYRHDTLKTLVPRRERRSDFVLVKVARCATFVVIVLVLGIGILQVIAMILGRLAGIPTIAAVPSALIPYAALVQQPEQYLLEAAQPGALAGYLGGVVAFGAIVALRMMFWGVIALGLTIVFRSDIGGMLSAFGLFGAQSILRLVSDSIPAFLPSFHLEYLIAHIGLIGNPAIVLGGWQPPIGLSLAYSIASIVALIGVFILLFRRQDIANK